MGVGGLTSSDIWSQRSPKVVLVFCVLVLWFLFWPSVYLSVSLSDCQRFMWNYLPVCKTVLFYIFYSCLMLCVVIKPYCVYVCLSFFYVKVFVHKQLWVHVWVILALYGFCCTIVICIWKKSTSMLYLWILLLVLVAKGYNKTNSIFLQTHHLLSTTFRYRSTLFNYVKSI